MPKGVVEHIGDDPLEEPQPVDAVRTGTSLARWLARSHAPMAASLGFGLAAGLVVLFAAVTATREERAREFAIMRAVGARASLLRQVQRAELAGVGLLAGFLASGVAAALAIGVGLFAGLAPLASRASSHREAPLTAADPQIDSTPRQGDPQPGPHVIQPWCPLPPVGTAVSIACTIGNARERSARKTALDFSGATSFNASTSPAIGQTIVTAPTITTIASNHNPSRSGQSVSLTVTVSAGYVTDVDFLTLGEDPGPEDHGPATTPDELVAIADQAMYDAKRRGDGEPVYIWDTATGRSTPTSSFPGSRTWSPRKDRKSCARRAFSPSPTMTTATCSRACT